MKKLMFTLAMLSLSTLAADIQKTLVIIKPMLLKKNISEKLSPVMKTAEI